MNAAAWEVIVLGGGPAGLLAAGRAAQCGARTLLLEKMEKPARKLRITGKGRCNLTNLRPLEAHLAEIHPEPRFLRSAFQAFFNQDLIDLLEAQGVPTVVERGDRVFPASGRAWDAAEALVAWAKAQGAVIRVKAPVEALEVVEGRIAGVRLASGERLEAKALVVATGGCSYPATGSTGDGFRFAEATGHRVTALRPSLVGLATRPALAAAAGLKLRNVALTLWIEGKKKATEFGEAEFTAQGLSGPIALRLSRAVVESLAAGQTVELTLDLKPALEAATLEARLDREAATRRTVGEQLRGLLPAPLVPVYGQRLDLPLGAPAVRLQGAPRRRLLALLKALPFTVTGHGGWEEAIVTAGGIALADLDPRTLASRRILGLHFAGEVLDLDANTGGYNLQIACSTGWLAGQSAAEWVQEGSPRRHGEHGEKMEKRKI
ncbi:MAG: tricarballylate dehydrogenase [Acidobacteria bacterium ADurb.Bin340]|nr:MAG: tricarballylate dehydrogenase [Acidobacteria bacterium ADurb.Bin340]